MRCLIVWLGGVAAAIIVIPGLGALLLPWLVDSRLVEEKVESILAE